MSSRNEAKIKFTADTAGLNESIKDSEKKMSSLRSELKLNNEEMKTSGVTVAGLCKNHSLLSQALKESQDKTDSLSAKLETAKQVFGEDSQEAAKWQTQLNNALASQERLKQSLQRCTEEIENQKRIEAESATGYAKLSTEISKQESDLENLKRSYANVIIEQGDTSREAQELEAQIGTLSAELNQNRQKLSEAENAAEEAAQSYSALGDSAEEAGQEAESSSDGYSITKDIIADLASNAIQGAIDKFKELSLEAEAAIDKMQAKVGASEQDMSKYKDVIMDVYDNAFGESIEDCTDALGTVIQMTDNLNEKDLNNMTENVMTLADVYDMDYAESMRAANSLVDQFGITYDEAFNLITQGAQEGLNQNGDLLDVINEYSVQFGNAGLSADDMFNMITNGANEGVWSIDKMGDSFKEFNIRMSDGTANQYLSDLGLNANEVVAKFQNGGADAKEAMKQIADAISSCDDKTLAYQSGVGIMGTMWEDMGQDACLALLNTEGAVSSTNDAMSQAKTDAYDNVDTSLKTISRTLSNDIGSPLSDVIGPAVNEILKFAIEHMDILEPIVLGLAAAFGTLAIALGISGLISGVQKAMALLNSTLWANPITWIVALIAGLVVAFVALWNKCDGFREFWIGLWDGVTSLFSGCADKIKSGVEGIGKKFASMKENASKVLSGLNSIAGNELSKLKGAFEENGGGIRGVAAAMWTGVKDIYKSGYDGLNTLTGGKLDNLKDAAAKKLEGFKGKFQSCKDTISKIFDFNIKMPDIKMPTVTVTWVTEGKLAEAAQFLKLPGLPKFDISWHAKGAILTQPTIFGFAGGRFQGGGEAGPEAVLPISLMQEYIDNSMMKFLSSIPQIDSDELGEKIAKATANNNMKLVVNDREVGRIVTKYTR